MGRRSLAISSLPDPLHQRVHPCRGRPSDASPHDTRDRNEEASFHRLASYGNPRFGALEHACGQRKSRALGPLQRGAPPGQDIGSAGGAEQASSDVDDSTSGDECRCALSGSNTGDQYINAADRIVRREDKISWYVFILPWLPMRNPFDDIRGARSNVRWECVDHLWSAGCSCLLHRRLQEPMCAAQLRRLVMHFVQGWTGAY